MSSSCVYIWTDSLSTSSLAQLQDRLVNNLGGTSKGRWTVEVKLFKITNEYQKKLNFKAIVQTKAENTAAASVQRIKQELESEQTEVAAGVSIQLSSSDLYVDSNSNTVLKSVPVSNLTSELNSNTNSHSTFKSTVNLTKKASESTQSDRCSSLVSSVALESGLRSNTALKTAEDQRMYILTIDTLTSEGASIFENTQRDRTQVRGPNSSARGQSKYSSRVLGAGAGAGASTGTTADKGRKIHLDLLGSETLQSGKLLVPSNIKELQSGFGVSPGPAGGLGGLVPRKQQWVAFEGSLRAFLVGPEYEFVVSKLKNIWKLRQSARIEGYSFHLHDFAIGIGNMMVGTAYKGLVIHIEYTACGDIGITEKLIDEMAKRILPSRGTIKKAKLSEDQKLENKGLAIMQYVNIFTENNLI